MAKTAIISGTILSHNLPGGDPPYPPMLACGRRRGRLDGTHPDVAFGQRRG